MIFTDLDMRQCGKPNPNCVRCGQPLNGKWIIIYDEIGELCVYCAQHTMRILLEDLIEYHNGTHISLLNIMYHGDKEEMDRVLMANKELGEHIAALNFEKLRTKEHYAELDHRTNKLFDFDNEKNESKK